MKKLFIFKKNFSYKINFRHLPFCPERLLFNFINYFIFRGPCPQNPKTPKPHMLISKEKNAAGTRNESNEGLLNR